MNPYQWGLCSITLNTYFVTLFQVKVIRGHEVKVLFFGISVVQYMFLVEFRKGRYVYYIPTI